MDTRRKEIERISSLLNSLGFNLEKEQPHISGERFLLAPDKLVLVGRRIEDGLQVIIKISNLLKGKEEIRQEKKIREALSSFVFSKEVMLFPREIYFGGYSPYLILITEFIHQEKVFISYTLKKQFSILLEAFKTREAFHRTNFGADKVSKTFPILQTKDYLENFKGFQASILHYYPMPGVEETMGAAWESLKNNEAIIEKYCQYLVHSDFAPHNFRIKDNSMYILDYSSFHFGNKYEGWARLLNYMVIHNPALEKKLQEHILNKQGESEYFDLRLMRIYKIGYLLKFYTQSLSKTASNLRVLTNHRIEFWEEVLRCIIQDKAVDEKILEAYIKNRDTLRSAEEKNRQREFAVA